MDSLSYYFDQRPLECGGANVIQVLKTCDGLVRNGTNVTLFAAAGKDLTNDQLKQLYGVESDIVIRRTAFFPWLKFIVNTLCMYMHFLSDKNKVVYTRNIYFAMLTSFSRKNVIFEAHQYTYPQAYHTLFHRVILKRLAGKKNFSMVVISEHLKHMLQKMGIIAPMLVCHDGYEPAESINQHEVPRIGRDGYEAVAVYTGSLLDIKGLRHIEFLAEHNKNVKFCLIGDLQFHADSETIARLKALDNVCLTGSVVHTDIPAYISVADICLLLPTAEGVYNDVTSPLKLFEYMHMGRAILSTDMPSLKEVLKHDSNGFIATDDSEDIDRKFKLLVSDTGLRRRLGDNAREDVKKFTWNERARKIICHISKNCRRTDLIRK